MGSKCGLPSVAALRLLREQMTAITSLLNSLREQSPDAVHEIRVASRRLRVILAEFSGVWESTSRKAFREQARVITKTLGVPRERDVCIRLLETLQSTSKDDTSAIAHLRKTWQADRRSHDGAVLGIAVLVESDEFRGAHEALLARFRRASICYRKLATARLKKRQNETAAAYKKWRKSPSDELLHALRIALKKLRYACEALREVFDQQEMDAAMEELKGTQKKLGEWHDWHVFGRHVKAEAEQAPKTLHDAMEALAGLANRNAQGALEAFRQQAKHLFEEKGPSFPSLHRHDCKQIHRRKVAKPAKNANKQEPLS